MCLVSKLNCPDCRSPVHIQLTLYPLLVEVTCMWRRCGFQGIYDKEKGKYIEVVKKKDGKNN